MVQGKCAFVLEAGACVEGYMDVDYVGDMDKRRSTLGYVFMFIGGAVSW